MPTISTLSAAALGHWERARFLEFRREPVRDRDRMKPRDLPPIARILDWHQQRDCVES